MESVISTIQPITVKLVIGNVIIPIRIQNLDFSRPMGAVGWGGRNGEHAFQQSIDKMKLNGIGNGVKLTLEIEGYNLNFEQIIKELNMR